MEGRVKVWDPYVRIFHWGLASAFIIAWFSADDMRDVHEVAGYVAGALVAVRLGMGLFGSRYARFRQFVRSPKHVLTYVKAMLRHQDRRYLGHNPLGGIMVMVLIALMGSLAFSGWLQTTDAYWGVEWVEDLHEILANLLLAAVGLHLAGVLFESLRHRENLVGAMVSGTKRMPAPDDVI